MAIKLPDVCSVKEMARVTFWRDLVSEVICSLYLVGVVTFAMVTLNAKVYSVTTTHVGLMVGFNIYMLIEGFGPISGAHMNPVVSFAFLLTGRITFIRAFFYTIAQCLGGVLGSSIAYGLAPASLRGNFAPFLPGADLGPERGMVVEMVFTFLLIYTCLSTTCDTIRTVMLPSLPTAFAVGVSIMCVGTWTGACLNPIVALGPAVISKNFSHHWIYWVGSYLGAAVASLTLRVFVLTRDKTVQKSSKKKPDDEKQIMLKEEISSLVEKVMSLSVEYQNNVTNDHKLKSHTGSQHNITSSSAAV